MTYGLYTFDYVSFVIRTYEYFWKKLYEKYIFFQRKIIRCITTHLQCFVISCFEAFNDVNLFLPKSDPDYLIGQKNVGIIFRRSILFAGQNFCHLQKISSFLSDTFLSDKVGRIMVIW